MRMLLLFLGFFVILAWGAPAFSACEKDTDCKGNRICEKGRCVNPPSPAAHPAKAVGETNPSVKQQAMLDELNDAKWARRATLIGGITGTVLAVGTGIGAGVAWGEYRSLGIGLLCGSVVSAAIAVVAWAQYPYYDKKVETLETKLGLSYLDPSAPPKDGRKRDPVPLALAWSWKF